MKKFVNAYIKIGTIIGATEIIRRQVNALYCPGCKEGVTGNYNRHPFLEAVGELCTETLLWPLCIPTILESIATNNDGGVVMKEEK